MELGEYRLEIHLTPRSGRIANQERIALPDSDSPRRVLPVFAGTCPRAGCLEREARYAAARRRRSFLVYPSERERVQRRRLYADGYPAPGLQPHLFGSRPTHQRYHAGRSLEANPDEAAEDANLGNCREEGVPR